MMRIEAGMFLIALALACGPTEPSDSETDGTSTSGPGTAGEPSTGEPATTVTAGTSTGEPATTDATTTTDGETTTPVDPTTTGATSTTTGDETTTSAADATTDASTGDTEAAPLVTEAWWVDSNELQIRIIQADPATGLCQGVWLQPVGNFGFEGNPKFASAELPEDWDVRFTWVQPDTDDCYDPYNWFMDETAYDNGGTGTVTFHDVDDTGRPASLDIEMTSTFEPSAPWVPAKNLFEAIDVPVQTG